MNNCPKCGYPIAPEETACTNCGEPVQNTNESNVSPENIEMIAEDSNIENTEIPSETLGVETVETLELNPEPVDDIIEDSESVAPDMPVAAPSTVEMPPVVDIPVAPIPMAPDMSVAAPSTVEMPPVVDVPVAPTPMAPDMSMAAPSTVEVPPIADVPVAPTPMAPDMSMAAPSTVEVPPVVDIPVAPTPMAPDMSMAAPSTVEMPAIVDMAVLPSAPSSNMMENADVAQTFNMAEVAIPQPVAEESATVNLSEKNPKKSMGAGFNKIIFLLVFLLSVVALALLAFFMIKLFSTENLVQGNKIPDAAREYHYEGFNLYIEEKDENKNDIHAEVYEGDFYIGTQTWSAVMTLQTGTYNTLVSNKSQLVDYFKDMGYEATEPVEKEIGGTSFVKMEVMMGSKNVLVAYAKANGTKLFGIVLENETGEYTDEDLRVLGKLLSTTKYVGPEYSLPEGFQLDLFKETFMVAE